MSKNKNSSIETIWGTTVGMIALMVVFLPGVLGLAGSILAIAGAACGTFFLSRQKSATASEVELRRELEDLKRSLAELQIHSADEDLKKQIEELSKKSG